MLLLLVALARVAQRNTPLGTLYLSRSTVLLPLRRSQTILQPDPHLILLVSI